MVYVESSEKSFVVYAETKEKVRGCEERSDELRKCLYWMLTCC